MARQLWGKLFADKGYISQALFEDLLTRGVQLISPIRKNMQNRLLSLMDKVLLCKRSLIETVYDQLKNISQIDHSRVLCIFAQKCAIASELAGFITVD